MDNAQLLLGSPGRKELVFKHDGKLLCQYETAFFDPWWVEQFWNPDSSMTQNVYQVQGDYLCVVAENRYELGPNGAIFRRYQATYEGCHYIPLKSQDGEYIPSTGKTTWTELDPSGKIVAGPVTSTYVNTNFVSFDPTSPAIIVDQRFGSPAQEVFHKIQVYSQGLKWMKDFYDPSPKSVSLIKDAQHG